MVNLLMFVFVIVMVGMVVAALPNIFKDGILFERVNTDAIRGIAILMILLSHIMQYTGNTISIIGGGITRAIVGCFGGIGVAVFFFLSGYGNYLSLNKLHSCKDVMCKTISRIIRLIVIFIVSFFVVGAIRIIMTYVFQVDSITIEELAKSMITLCMAGTSTWYLKIQILFYICAAIAFIAAPTKYRNWIIVLLAGGYVLIARHLGLQDFWWKTAMCFSAGSICAENISGIGQIVAKHKIVVFVTLLMLTGCAYLWVLKDGNYRLVPQLLSFVIFSLAIPVLCSVLQLGWKPFVIMGKASLPIYLIHIGLAVGILSQLKNVNLQISIYLVLTIILSIVVYYIDKKVAKHCWGKR